MAAHSATPGSDGAGGPAHIVPERNRKRDGARFDKLWTIAIAFAFDSEPPLGESQTEFQSLLTDFPAARSRVAY
jgi:hypothetical protein